MVERASTARGWKVQGLFSPKSVIVKQNFATQTSTTFNGHQRTTQYKQRIVIETICKHNEFVHCIYISFNFYIQQRGRKHKNGKAVAKKQ